MKILITGVAGLLGVHFSKYLLDKGYDVIGIDDLSGGYKDFIDVRVKFYKLNLIDSEKLEQIFINEKIDYIYHFAAYAAEGLSPFIRNFNYINNVICSINIINNCIKYDIKKIIFTSSMAVYGYGSPPFTEEQLPNPIDPYGIAKYAVEMDLKSAYDQFGLNYSIIRPHNVIGIYQNIWDRYRNVIGIWIRQSINNQNLTIYGDGQQKRAFSDINYYMEPFEKLMFDFNNEIFNIGSDKDITIYDVAEMVKKISIERGYNVDIEFLQQRHEVKYAYSSHNKAKKMLNFIDETDIENVIENMFDWAIQQPKRLIRNIDYEIDKNIYPYWKKV